MTTNTNTMPLSEMIAAAKKVGDVIITKNSTMTGCWIKISVHKCTDIDAVKDMGFIQDEYTGLAKFWKKEVFIATDTMSDFIAVSNIN